MIFIASALIIILNANLLLDMLEHLPELTKVQNGLLKLSDLCEGSWLFKNDQEYLDYIEELKAGILFLLLRINIPALILFLVSLKGRSILKQT